MGYRLREITDAGGTVEKIRCLSMGTLMKECHIDKIDLLKCDIEGAEAAVFGQCAPWINRVRHIAVETHRPYLPEDLLADLARNGGDFEMQQNTVSTQHHVCFSGQQKSRMTCEPESPFSGLPLELEVVDRDGGARRHPLASSRPRAHTFRVAATGPARAIRVDPNGGVLKRLAGKEIG